jgi:hypothetical protein
MEEKKEIISETKTEEELKNEKNEKVTPWEVKGNIKYEKLVEEFGTQIITEE